MLPPGVAESDVLWCLCIGNGDLGVRWGAGGTGGGGSWVGLQSVTYTPVELGPPFSKGEGENLTRLLVETNPESDRLAPMGVGPMGPPATSSDNESGGVGLVGVPPEEPPPAP